MGKRKRRTDLNKTPPRTDQLQSPEMDPLSKQTFTHQVESRARKSFSSIMDIIDDSSKVLQCQQSPIIHCRNIEQAMCSTNPRHYSHHYSRRRSANKAGPSTSRGGVTPCSDEKMSLNAATKCHSDSGHDTESRQIEFHEPERVAPGLLIPSDVNKQFCGICQKPLRKKRYILDHSTMSSNEPSVVAVLVCGHIYHADCLEQRTCHEDATDPPCPICLGLLSQVETSAQRD